MIYIALGSNLGDKAHHLHMACKHITQFASIESKSQAIETKALLPENAPSSWDMPFLNQVIAITTDLPPAELLKSLQGIERQMGRDSKEKWAPRVIDLDILWFNGITLTSSVLQIPHPEIVNRSFIIKLMNELAPEVISQIVPSKDRILDISKIPVL